MHMEVPQILGRPPRSIQQGAARSPTRQTVLTGTGLAEAPTLNWVPGKQRSLASTGLDRIRRRGWGQDWPGKVRVFKLLQSKLAFLVLRTLLEAGVWVTDAGKHSPVVPTPTQCQRKAKLGLEKAKGATVCRGPAIWVLELGGSPAPPPS